MKEYYLKDFSDCFERYIEKVLYICIQIENTMRIKTFEDIESIDTELAGLFLCHDEAVQWIATVNSGIKDWIAKHKKQHWEVVRYVSEKRGKLGKRQADVRKYKLTRVDFANILIKFCPEALSEGETVSKLKTSMEHYQEAKDYYQGINTGAFLALCEEVKAIFDNCPLEQVETTDSRPSLVELMKEYLNSIIVDNGSFPRSVVREREQYGGATPALSVETYFSQKFLNERSYSSAIAYEIVEELLTESKLIELIGIYTSKCHDIIRPRLFIVSTRGLLQNVRKLASDNGVGYMRIDPNRKYVHPDYVLPRSTDDLVRRAHDAEILYGKRPMNSPLLIMDGYNLTSSLSDVLQSHGVQVKPRVIVDISYLRDEDIEAEADKLSKEYVDDCIRKKYLWYDYKELSVDPFAIAEKLGLTHSIETLDNDDQLGWLDIEKCHVTLNASLLRNQKRMRFTMAHELGHFLLHLHWFNSRGIVSVEETEHTLTSNVIYDQRLVEHQANLFAASLLMPKNLVAVLFFDYYNKYVQEDSNPKLYYNPSQDETRSNYNNVVGRMAFLLNVSLEAIYIRLKSLNFLKKVRR